jgi:hypothetical protein
MRYWCQVIVAIHASILSLIGQTIGFDVPAGTLLVEGNSSSSVPFNIGPAQASSVRYQQVHAASRFLPDSGLVSTMYFRVDAFQGNGFFAVLPNIQINMSTSPRGPDSLSPVFAENVGPDDTVVFGPGPLEIRSGFAHMGVPQFFEVRIPLARPFFYNPAAGHLLLDVRTVGGGGAWTSIFDAQNFVGDDVSRVYNFSADGTGGVEATSGRVETTGLVLILNITPIPEPPAGSLFLFGGAALGVLLFIFRSRKQPTVATETEAM